MKCPECGWPARTSVPRCPGCGFDLGRADRRLGPAPDFTDPLLDDAGVLAPVARAGLEARLRAAGARLGGIIAVVTRRSTAPVRPAVHAFWLFNRWALGRPHHRGLLVLLALDEQRVETEVGEGWAAVATDPATARILDECVVPLLREGDHAGALAAAVDGFEALLGGAPAAEDR